MNGAGVSMVISGHVHRGISGVWRGLPFATLPSTCHQMPLMLGPGTSDISVDEPGGYGVLLARDEGPILHIGTTTDAPVFSEPGSA